MSALCALKVIRARRGAPIYNGSSIGGLARHTLGCIGLYCTQNGGWWRMYGRSMEKVSIHRWLRRQTVYEPRKQQSECCSDQAISGTFFRCFRRFVGLSCPPFLNNSNHSCQHFARLHSSVEWHGPKQTIVCLLLWPMPRRRRYPPIGTLPTSQCQ